MNVWACLWTMVVSKFTLSKGSRLKICLRKSWGVTDDMSHFSLLRTNSSHLCNKKKQALIQVQSVNIIWVYVEIHNRYRTHHLNTRGVGETERPVARHSNYIHLHSSFDLLALYVNHHTQWTGHNQLSLSYTLSLYSWENMQFNLTINNI